MFNMKVKFFKKSYEVGGKSTTNFASHTSN